MTHIFARRWFSCIMGVYYSTKYSAKALPKFIAENSIDLSRCEMAKNGFSSFNDFFTRSEARESHEPATRLIAPCDGKVAAYHITSELSLHIKQSVYTIAQLLNDHEDSAQFVDGICLVYRLSLTDYHRYYFVDSGTIKSHKAIRGLLHTVRPISAQYNVFAQNCREVTMLNTDHFGTVAHIEVGAMLVGKIHNSKQHGSFNRMEEKGYFAYGGSTIVQLFRHGMVRIDEDIMRVSGMGAEVIVACGEGVGGRKNA